MNFDIITVLGCTATGKTKLAAQLCSIFNGEIISADSRQVYKQMNIGTGKDLAEYEISGNTIPHHLIDVIEPAEEFNLFLFRELFQNSFDDIVKRKKLPFLVGGTGLYLSAVLSGYNLSKVDFENEYQKFENLSVAELREILLNISGGLHNTTDLLEKDRIIRAIIIAKHNNKSDSQKPISSFVIGISLPRDEIKNRITERLKKRLNEGMIDEVKLLLDSGVSYEKMLFFGLEYKFVAQYLKDELSYNDMYQKLNSSIHAFAKRQMTWFRKMEREGIAINWIDGADFNRAKDLIEKNLC